MGVTGLEDLEEEEESPGSPRCVRVKRTGPAHPWTSRVEGLVLSKFPAPPTPRPGFGGALDEGLANDLPETVLRGPQDHPPGLQ